MKTEIQIDWEKTPTKLGVLKTILIQAKAPDWHGLSLDALEDSLVVGQINGTNPPYGFHLKNLNTEDEELKSFQSALIDIFLECVRKYDGSTITID